MDWQSHSTPFTMTRLLFDVQRFHMLVWWVSTATVIESPILSLENRIRTFKISYAPIRYWATVLRSYFAAHTETESSTEKSRCCQGSREVYLF